MCLVHICVPPIVLKKLFPWCPPSIPGVAIYFSISFSSGFPKPQGERFYVEIPFRTVCPKASHSSWRFCVCSYLLRKELEDD